MIRTHFFTELIVFQKIVKVPSVDVRDHILSSLIDSVLTISHWTQDLKL